MDARATAAMVTDISRLARETGIKVIALDLQRAGIETPVQACVVGSALSFLPPLPLAVVVQRWGQLLTDQVKRAAPVEYFNSPAMALGTARSMYL